MSFLNVNLQHGFFKAWVFLFCLVSPGLAGDHAPDHQAEMLRLMVESNDLSEAQETMISHLLNEQAEAISLFTNHGLLSPLELQGKVRDIRETIFARINFLLDPQQQETWRRWNPRIVRRSHVSPETSR